MKKLLLATFVSTFSIGAAQAEDPTVYGKINVSVNRVKDDLNKGTTTKVDSNSSRFGIKGNEKLTDNLSALYGIEWEVSIYTHKDLGLYTGVAFAHNAPATTLVTYSTINSTPATTLSAAAALNIWRWVGSVDLTKAGVDGVSLNAFIKNNDQPFNNLAQRNSFLEES